MDPNFFKSKIILGQNFLHPILLNQTFLVQNDFDGPKKIWTEMFLDQKIFSSKFFWPRFFYQNFFDQNFADQKCFFDQNFLSTNFGLFTVSLVWYGFIGFNFDFQYLIAIEANMFVSLFIQS